MGLIPIMNSRPERTITIPKLSGGMNLRDSPTMVNDNQVTDAENMWFCDGILKTRPGISYKEDICNNDFTATANQRFSSSKKENAYKAYNGERRRLISRHDLFLTRHTSDSPLYPSASCIQFAFVGTTEREALPDIEINNFGVQNYFVVQNKTDLYCFVDAYNSSNHDYRIYKLADGSEQWGQLSENDIYTPLVYTHCKCDKIGNNFEGTQFEGFNSITNRFKMVYSTVNTALLTSTTTTHLMQYVIPECGKQGARSRMISDFKVKITYSGGSVVTHTLTTQQGTEYIESTRQSDNLRMSANPIGDGKMLIVFDNADGSLHSVSAADFLEDNMEIIAPCENSEENYKKVFCMSRSEWFGSSASGLYGGSRLFLGGNYDDKEKALLLWSGLNNPLYFNENCYAYAGNTSESITGFGKQNDLLVILKESGVYATQYKLNSDISADDLINQKVVDYSANSAYFPITAINDTVGCDCPDTVQLCRNRLVWAHSDGKIYTLCSENQYSERNIYDVSEMITRKLKTEAVTALKAAHSADWNGRYILFVGSHAYVMDYNSHGYQYPYSYSKNEDANINIPWFYWDLNGLNPASVITTDGSLLFFGFDEYIFKSFKADCSKNTDNFNGSDLQIQSFIKTKMFDFRAPAHNKRISLANIAFGNNGGIPIDVSFITEKGANLDSTTIELTESGENPYSNEYVHNKQIRPYARFCNRFGMYITCDGNLAVDSISINYTVTGGAR